MAKDNRPRISVNKLAEYMGAKAARKRQILRDQKFPEFKGPYYREASEAVSRCLASGLEDISTLARAIRVLNQMEPEKAGALRRINSNLDAIENFEAMLDDIDFKGGRPELGEHTPEKLAIWGVEVSVRPEIVLRGTASGGKPLVGALKVHFPKTFSLDADAGGYVSALLQRYSEEKLASPEEAVGSAYCFVIDVGSRTVHPGVKSVRARFKDIESECRNIAALWSSISPDE
jgi:hypothetical protein